MSKKHLILASVAMSLVMTGPIAYADKAMQLADNELREKVTEPWEDNRDEKREEKTEDRARHYTHKHKHKHKHKVKHAQKPKAQAHKHRSHKKHQETQSTEQPAREKKGNR